jgi:hypothetical protein
MEEYRIKMLIDSYGIDDLLDKADIQPEAALRALIVAGLIDLDDFFDLKGDEDE